MNNIPFRPSPNSLITRIEPEKNVLLIHNPILERDILNRKDLLLQTNRTQYEHRALLDEAGRRRWRQATAVLRRDIVRMEAELARDEARLEEITLFLQNLESGKKS
ncbi:MAG: hypothetical protein Q9164_004055 [Protoblastenia rupestris]